jgi:hypothetical protein
MADEDRSGATVTREFLAERDVRMFKMRQAGVASQEISRRFGVSSSAVSRAVNRQLEKLNAEALLAYPEVLRLELERLDSLQAAIWPMTQHRRVTLDDGTDVSVEPDLKALQQVLSIMDRRSKLLGMEQRNVSVQMDVALSQPNQIRASVAGRTADSLTRNTFSAEEEARQLLSLMVKSGVVSPDEIEGALGVKGTEDLLEGGVVDAEIVEESDE